MNVYYKSLSRLYAAGLIAADKVQSAVAKGWITAEEAAEIIGG